MEGYPPDESAYVANRVQAQGQFVSLSHACDTLCCALFAGDKIVCSDLEQILQLKPLNSLPSFEAAINAESVCARRPLKPLNIAIPPKAFHLICVLFILRLNLD